MACVDHLAVALLEFLHRQITRRIDEAPRLGEHGEEIAHMRLHLGERALVVVADVHHASDRRLLRRDGVAIVASTLLEQRLRLQLRGDRAEGRGVAEAVAGGELDRAGTARAYQIGPWMRLLERPRPDVQVAVIVEAAMMV